MIQIEFDFAGCQIVVNFLILVGCQVAEFIVFELQTDTFVAGVVLNNLSAFEVILGIIAEDFLESTANVVDCGSDNFV